MMRINLSREQFYSLIVGLAVLVTLLLFPTKPKKLLDEERSRAMNTMSTDVMILKREVFEEMPASLASRFRLLENQLEATSDSAARLSLLQSLSGEWYDNNQYAIAGDYAEKAAELAGTAAAYGIAGTTYAIGINRALKEKEKSYCLAKALDMLERAISLDPDEINYQINRGVILAEHPDPNNPMKGVLLLIELNKNFPENVSVINNLAKFALQTNQLERAEQRLMEAIALDPDNLMTNCLLVKLYQTLGNADKMNIYATKCQQ